jgi:hypothetical protein
MTGNEKIKMNFFRYDYSSEIHHRLMSNSAARASANTSPTDRHWYYSAARTSADISPTDTGRRILYIFLKRQMLFNYHNQT